VLAEGTEFSLLCDSSRAALDACAARLIGGARIQASRRRGRRRAARAGALAAGAGSG
jgi:hypothetical protein